MPRRQVTEIRSINDLLAVFTVQANATPGERLAEFLNFAADQLPHMFVDKRIAAKVACALKRAPAEDSDYVRRKLQSAMTSARRILQRDYGRDLHTDKIEGLRATVDPRDAAGTTYRSTRNRIHSAIKSHKKVDALIDISKLSGALRKEVAQTRNSYEALDKFTNDIPLLPPKKGKKE
jgi:hypothetical protein